MKSKEITLDGRRLKRLTIDNALVYEGVKKRYKVLSYLMAGDGKHCVDTQFSDSAMKWVVRCMTPDASRNYGAGKYIIGCGAAGGFTDNGYMSIYIGFSSNPSKGQVNFAWSKKGNNFNPEGLYMYDNVFVELSLSVTPESVEISFDGKKKTYNAVAGYSPRGNVLLFRQSNDNNVLSYCRRAITHVEIYDHDMQLARDMYACERIEDGALGYWCTVSKTFYPATGGTFTKGEETGEFF